MTNLLVDREKNRTIELTGISNEVSSCCYLDNSVVFPISILILSYCALPPNAGGHQVHFCPRPRLNKNSHFPRPLCPPLHPTPHAPWLTTHMRPPTRMRFPPHRNQKCLSNSYRRPLGRSTVSSLRVLGVARPDITFAGPAGVDVKTSRKREREISLEPATPQTTARVRCRSNRPI